MHRYLTTLLVIGVGMVWTGAATATTGIEVTPVTPADANAVIPGVETAVVELAEKPAPALVQMAILLDTSGSMSGLIDQAKTQLWSIVNELALSRRNGVAPVVQVALYEYGNDGLQSENGWVRQILPLTTDLDDVSEKLFALTTNGGSEFCGLVIDKSVAELAWSAQDDYKVIFIAGNEPFTQGPKDFREACKTAIEKGVVVNTIHCGGYEEGVSGHWKDGALLADGKYLNIDQNRTVVHIEAPQDEEIARLGAQLNETYVAYGARGSMGLARQQAQDSNAQTIAPQASLGRAVTKSSKQYRNSSWDLVDALEEKEVELDKLSDRELPKEMRGMSLDERQAYLETKRAERVTLQEQIQQLDRQRREFVAAEMKKRADQGQDTLGAAVIAAVREQAAARRFEFNTESGD